MRANKIFIILFLIVLFKSFFVYAELETTKQELTQDQKKEIAKPLIYNEEALTNELKGKGKEEVLKILGEPAVKKPSQESEGNLEYWWYSLPEAGLFVYFKDDRVYNISVLTEDKRSKEL